MTNLITINYQLVATTAALDERLAKQSEHYLLKSHELGADREQWFVEFQGDLVVICVEHLSESAWLETMGQVCEGKLQNFYKLLFCH